LLFLLDRAFIQRKTLVQQRPVESGTGHGKSKEKMPVQNFQNFLSPEFPFLCRGIMAIARALYSARNTLDREAVCHEIPPL
jgi:hypothetical protein